MRKLSIYIRHYCPLMVEKACMRDAVHAAVLKAKEKRSGITIHYVDDKYDHGEIIFSKGMPG